MQNGTTSQTKDCKFRVRTSGGRGARTLISPSPFQYSGIHFQSFVGADVYSGVSSTVLRSQVKQLRPQEASKDCIKSYSVRTLRL